MLAPLGLEALGVIPNILGRVIIVVETTLEGNARLSTEIFRGIMELDELCRALATLLQDPFGLFNVSVKSTLLLRQLGWRDDLGH